MITYEEAKSRFKKCRNKKLGYKLANNTRLQKRGHAFSVRLHQTDVVMIRPDGTYRLNTYGWRTAVTKNRINMTLPITCYVSQKNGLWFIEPGNTQYSDGMLIGPDGKVIKANHLRDLPEIKLMVDRHVSKFIKIFTKMYTETYFGGRESDSKRTVPRFTGKNHLKVIWEMILDTTREGFVFSPATRLRLIHWAILASNHKNKGPVRNNIIRSDCKLSTEPEFIDNNLRSFMIIRKTLIAEMIADGTLQRPQV